MNFTFDKKDCCDNNIHINSFDLTIGSKVLFKNSKLSIQKNTIYGLVGINGSGKSSLLKEIYKIQNELYSEKDSVKIDTLYVEQEITIDSRNPVDFITDSNYKLKKKEEELNTILASMEKDCSDKMYKILQEQSIELYNILNTWNPDMEEVLVIKILKGLGFTDKMLKEESTLLSGGWIMRLSLARSLYLQPSILLLDEPTNHLDLEAIIWLSDYLNIWNKTVIVVSHNIGFLNDTCDYIICIEESKLVYYKGNYNAFKDGKESKKQEIKNKWDKYEKQLKDIKKKGNKDKITEFEKHKVDKPAPLYSVYIKFDTTGNINGNILSLENVSFQYNGVLPILDKVTCGLDMKSKIALVGLNGSGKSTLVKLLTQELTPTSGSIFVHPQARIGYYNQHFENNLPQDLTPVEYIQSSMEVDINIIRQQFGMIKLDKTCLVKKISTLSGGQKARVAIVKLILMNPHFLILDEPTNHLDIESVEALIEGLVNFTGGVLVITHESELIKKINSEIWMMNPITKNINYHIESYDEYKKML